MKKKHYLHFEATRIWKLFFWAVWAFKDYKWGPQEYNCWYHEDYCFHWEIFGILKTNTKCSMLASRTRRNDELLSIQTNEYFCYFNLNQQTCCWIKACRIPYVLFWGSDSHPGSIHPRIQLTVAARVHKKIPNLIVFLCFPKHIANKKYFFLFRPSPFNARLFIFPIFMNTSKKYILISFERTQALFPRSRSTSFWPLLILTVNIHFYIVEFFAMILVAICTIDFLQEWFGKPRAKTSIKQGWQGKWKMVLRETLFAAEWVSIFFHVVVKFDYPEKCPLCFITTHEIYESKLNLLQRKKKVYVV